MVSVVRADDARNATAQSRGINFLLSIQQDSGGFPAYEWPTVRPDAKHLVDSPFTVSQVLLSLRFYGNDAAVTKLRSRAVQYLISQQDPSGVWRYFGKARSISPDVDDTAMAWAALEFAGHKIPPEALGALQACQNRDGLFNTWMGDPSTWHGMDTTAIDAVVNANALLVMYPHGGNLDKVCDFLNSQAQGEAMNRGTVYYTPIFFAAAFSRAYRDGGAKCLEEGSHKIRNAVLALQQPDGGWGDDLETVAATLTLINLHDRTAAVDKAINAILARQTADGGWQLAAAYAGNNGRARYGSRAVTTALCIETLAKYTAR